MISNSVDKENTNPNQVSPHWFIDLDWYQRSNRSFFAMAQGRLYSKCQEWQKGGISEADLLTIIKDCCSKTLNFITGKLLILESIFRLFLVNGNQPLDLEELGKQLSEWLGGDTYRTSVEILPRFLRRDQHYGLRQINK